MPIQLRAVFELCQQSSVGRVESIQFNRLLSRGSSVGETTEVAIGQGEVTVDERVVGAEDRGRAIGFHGANPLPAFKGDVAHFDRINALTGRKVTRLLGGVRGETMTYAVRISAPAKERCRSSSPRQRAK